MAHPANKATSTAATSRTAPQVHYQVEDEDVAMTPVAQMPNGATRKAAPRSRSRVPSVRNRGDGPLQAPNTATNDVDAEMKAIFASVKAMKEEWDYLERIAAGLGKRKREASPVEHEAEDTVGPASQRVPDISPDSFDPDTFLADPVRAPPARAANTAPATTTPVAQTNASGGPGAGDGRPQANPPVANVPTILRQVMPDMYRPRFGTPAPPSNATSTTDVVMTDAAPIPNSMPPMQARPVPATHTPSGTPGAPRMMEIGAFYTTGTDTGSRQFVAPDLSPAASPTVNAHLMFVPATKMTKRSTTQPTTKLMQSSDRLMDAANPSPRNGNPPPPSAPASALYAPDHRTPDRQQRLPSSAPAPSVISAGIGKRRGDSAIQTARTTGDSASPPRGSHLTPIFQTPQHATQQVPPPSVVHGPQQPAPRVCRCENRHPMGETNVCVNCGANIV